MIQDIYYFQKNLKKKIKNLSELNDLINPKKFIYLYI